jgi:hypothetical protein
MKLLSALLLLAVAATRVVAAEIWVSPSGRDAAAGTKDAPVATLTRAAELVRAARTAQPAEPVTVWLGAGDYTVLDSFSFTGPDSGSATARVTWRGVDRAKVRLLGARTIDRAKLRPLSDPALLARLAPEAQGKILEFDLAAAKTRFAARLPDFIRDDVNLFSVYFDGRRLPLSRWPNGEFGYTTMKRVLNSGNFAANKPDGGTFEYREDRPQRWAAAVAENGVWLRGFWRVPWVAETLRVKAIDPQAKTITFALSTSNGIGSKYSPLENGTRIGDGKEAWFALNLLEEIDQPGEWSVDFTRQKLYLFPPANFDKGELAISDNNRPLLNFSGASFVTFRDVTLGVQMGDAVSITNGESVSIAGCRIESVSRRGVVIRGGRNHEVRSCDLTEIGFTAIDVLGGDRKTLTPSGHQIVNNHIWRVALGGPVPALTAGLDINRNQLVGARLAHNRIHDATYGGITFAGNDNVIEFNEVYRIGLDGGDLGGLYTNSGWTSRGNVLRHNFIHHAENANAIYLDDGTCGVLVENNLTYRTETGVFIGGGSDNIARGNIIVAAHHGIHVDDRGVARKYVATDPRLRRDLDGVPYTTPPWSTKYPLLAKILETDPSIARNNDLSGNFLVGCGSPSRRSGRPETLVGFAFANNLEFPASVYADPASLNFTLTNAKSGAPAVDFARYGLQVDEFRPTLPARDLELLKSGDTKRKKFDSQQDVDAYKR